MRVCGQICGLESRKSDWKQSKETPVEHIRRLRNHPLLAYSMFVVQIESNLAYESDHHAEHLEKYPDLGNLVYMRECQSRVGTHTSAKTKEQMTLLFLETISAEALLIFDELITTEDDAETMLTCLFTQLENFSVIPTKSGGKVYTGKVNKMQDDLAMCLMMNLLYRKMFLVDADRYGRYHSHNPY